MKIVYLDTYPLGDVNLDRISTLGDYTGYDDTQPEQVVLRAQGANVVIVNKVRLMKPELDALPDLQLICVSATGVNNVDTAYAAEKGITVRNVPAYSTESVAEATIGMALALLRNIVFYDGYVKNGTYSASGRAFHMALPVGEIKGKTWGVIGMGAIGHRVAELAEAFGAKVIYHSTTGKNTNGGYPHFSLNELLMKSDIVSIHAPLNDRTKGLIGSAQFELVKPSAILINAGRGGIVVENALADALDADLLAGAGLDVFETEPLPGDSKLLQLQQSYKLILAPHSAWASREARDVLVGKVAENICTFYER